MLCRGAVESLREFLWRFVMKFPEFNLFSDKSAQFLPAFARISMFFQNFWGAVAPPALVSYAYEYSLHKVS
jgi:hypothetical protein